MTPNLALPYLQPSQAQKHVTVNESLRRLDALVQLTAVTASLAVQPAAPAEGAVYILPPGKTGAAWGPMASGALAYFRDGAWEALPPRAGWQAYVLDQARTLVFGGGAWTSPASAAGRERLSGARTYFVRIDGADAQTGLADSAGGAFRTIQKAIDTACGLDLNGHDVTIRIGNGTWTEALRFRSLTGDGQVVLLGNEASPSSVYLAVTGAHALAAEGVRGRYAVRGLKIETSGTGHGLAAFGAGAALSFRAIEFGAVASSQIYAESGGTIEGTGPYAISGNAERHVNALLRAEINIRNCAVTLTNAPVFAAAFANAARLAVINANAMSFTGSASGKRHDASANAVIFTGGGAAAYFPGTSAGTVATGGQFL